MSRTPRSALVVALLVVVAGVALVSTAQAAGALSAEAAAEIDRATEAVLRNTGVSSASVAVVRNGEIVLAKAYGMARIDPPAPATAAMRYPIGSISKQFVAAAVVMLAQEGKLGLDDPIARFLPEVTRADDITARQLLSHTSGIRDYWPQDYVPPTMREPIGTAELIARHAHQPLDFEPGTQWQYSNTGYVIAGAIVEQAGGKPLMDFLAERIFEPLGMDSVFDIDAGPLPDTDAAGYQRFALGPLRRAPKEGRGWLFSAGQLAMTAEDLAKWSVALMEGKTPGAAVVRELAREAVLASGVGTGYGLGLGVSLRGGRRVLGHGGEVSGFTATQRVFPEDGLAIVVLANQDAANAAPGIARRIEHVLLVGHSPEDAEMERRVAALLDGLRKGQLDRSQLTANGNAYFSETALADIKSSLRKLGSRRSIELEARSLRGGLTTRVYSALYKKKRLEVVTRAAADGKLEQLTISVE